MKKLIVYYGDTPVCVEGFPEDCKRSKEGALHILPRKNMTVTDQEYDHILKSRPDMKKLLRVIASGLKDKEPKKEKAETKKGDVEKSASPKKEEAVSKKEPVQKEEPEAKDSGKKSSKKKPKLDK